MCAIVDVNVSHEVFGDNRPEAGRRFFERLDSGLLRLVVSRKLLAELNYVKARQWIQQGILAGRIRQETPSTVDEREEELDRPRGKVYSTNERKDFTNAHQKLLSNRNLCRSR